MSEEKTDEMERMLRKRENDVHNKELSLESTLRAQRDRCYLAAYCSCSHSHPPVHKEANDIMGLIYK